MGDVPVLKPSEVVAILQSLGFYSPILLKQIARDIGVTIRELLKHR